MEKKELLEELEGLKKDLETSLEQKAVKNFDEKFEAINKTIEEVKSAKPEVTAEELAAVKEDLKVTIKALDQVQIRFKNGNTPASKPEVKSFNDILAETIERHADEIKSYKKGNAPLSMDMLPDVKADKEGKKEVKAVGDMSIAANYSDAATTVTRDVRSNLIERPYNRVWLGDLLPQGTTKGSSIIYPKENGGEGGAAVWTDPTADKAQMDFDFTSQSAYVKWIAGTVIIAREMLDDIDFLNAYLRQKMLISLKIAENDFILNGTSDTNPVQGFNDVATAYDGDYTAAVDRIIDAGWGQLVESTYDFYNPTTTILTPRDAVKVGLNKATGSGEYDLPAGSVAYANGALQVGGIDVVRSTSVGTGNFITFDKNATMFVKRMQPELRLFEDATLAKKNKLMFRVEERVTLAIFNNAAIVKGTLEA